MSPISNISNNTLPQFQPTATPGSNSIKILIKAQNEAFGSIPSEIPAVAESSSGWNRFWGVVKAVGGAAESAAGFVGGLASSVTGGGLVAGGAVCVHGLDTTSTGVLQVITGKEEKTLTSLGIADVTGSEKAGEIADFSIGLIGPGAIGYATKFAEGLPRIAKGITWTTEMEAGTGETLENGAIIVSSLGTALDRTQVLAHEKVHSLFRPNVGEFLSDVRRDAASFYYSVFPSLRYAEEVIAESSAQIATRSETGLGIFDSIKKAIQFGFRYFEEDHEAAQALAEGVGITAKTADTLKQASEQ